VYQRQHTVKTMYQVVTAFQQRFRKPFPLRAALFSWEKRTFSYGNVKDSPRSGRQISRTVTCAAVAASVKIRRTKSVRKLSAELGVPRLTMFRHMKKYLQMKSVRAIFVKELSDADLRRHTKHVLCCWNDFQQPCHVGKFSFQKNV
jgi:hypothetical protein